MVKLFFLLSGEHETLPASEIKAILEAEGFPFKVLGKLDQVLRVEADLKCVEAVRNRAAYTRLCGLELFLSDAEQSQIMKAACDVDFSQVLGRGDSFAVRVKHVKTHAPEVDAMTVERRLGALILSMVDGVRVKLESPEKTFSGILTDNKFVFGLKLAEVSPKPFTERRPKKKPFFHPSAMPPKLARCMVNLARPKAGNLVFDPFCGTGSIIIEAALIGCRVLGMDVQRRMAAGALKNFAFFGLKPEGLLVADARKPPVTAVDCVVADPPYGRSATTLKRATEQIIEDTLKAVYAMLSEGRLVCVAAPKTVRVSRIGVDLGYKHLESHLVYIHRGLTREIAVFEKV
ncbi:MAG: TRM11 family methyltransferase [Nitrososphaerota archaeon]|nr:TRM11 family methyltransferase [Candidatus Bathyarchaeota archaeon]MDW8022807.1 TRM11 family methyltransferase [Nitrososphaerota archaeon]